MEENITPHRYHSLMSLLKSDYVPITPPKPRFAPFGELGTTSPKITTNNPTTTNDIENNGNINNRNGKKKNKGESASSTPATTTTTTTTTKTSTPQTPITPNARNSSASNNNNNNNNTNNKNKNKNSSNDNHNTNGNAHPNKKLRSVETESNSTPSKFTITITKTANTTTTTTTSTALPLSPLLSSPVSPISNETTPKVNKPSTTTKSTPQNQNGFQENLDFVSLYSESVEEQVIVAPVWMQTTQDKITLAEEIESFCNWAQPTKEEKSMRNYVVSEITKIVTNIWPRAKVHLFGSLKTGVTLPSSDIDIAVVTDPRDPYTQRPIVTLFDELRGPHSVFSSNIQMISKAKVPIIKLISSLTNYKVDISFNSTGGVENGRIINSYFKEYPQLRPLIYVLKYLLYQYAFNEPFTGGLGSYALCIMAVFHLQEVDRRKTPALWESKLNDKSNTSLRESLIGTSSTKMSQYKTNLGYLLVDFLDYYSSFDYRRKGISLRKENTYPISLRFPNDSLYIEDPQDQSNDVGRSSYAFNKIQQIFRSTHLRLTTPRIEDLNHLRSFKFTTLLSRILEVDQHIVDHRLKIQRMIMWMGNKIQESSKYQFEQDDDDDEKDARKGKSSIALNVRDRDSDNNSPIISVEKSSKEKSRKTFHKFSDSEDEVLIVDDPYDPFDPYDSDVIEIKDHKNSSSRSHSDNGSSSGRKSKGYKKRESSSDEDSEVEEKKRLGNKNNKTSNNNSNNSNKKKKKREESDDEEIDDNDIIDITNIDSYDEKEKEKKKDNDKDKKKEEEKITSNSRQRKREWDL